MSASLLSLDAHGDRHSLDKAPAGAHHETVTFSCFSTLGSTLLINVGEKVNVNAVLLV